jgi:hypothetical protein
VTIFEIMVSGSLVVGTWLFEHFIEDAPVGGASRFLALGSSDKLVGWGLELALLVLLLLPVVSLGAPGGARGIVDLLFPFVLVTPTASSPMAKLVTMSINPLAVSGVLRPNSRTNSLQVVPERKAIITSESVMLGSSIRCREKRRM